MKGYNGPLILCAALLFGAILVSPAFADMKKVDETDLSQIKASVTGASVKNRTADLDKDVRDQESLLASERENFNKDAQVSPSVSNESKTVDQHISDRTTSNFGFTGMNMITTGGITAAKPR